MTDDMVKNFVMVLRQSQGEASVRCLESLPLADAIEALTVERYEAINQLDSAIHSKIVLEKRTAAVMEDRKLIIEERDRTFALMLVRAEKAEADNARLRDALEDCAQFTGICGYTARDALNTGKEVMPDGTRKVPNNDIGPGDQGVVAGAAPVTLTYTNWRGETAERTIIPARLWFGSTDWHPEPQWLLEAMDVEKGAMRDFALKDFGRPEPVAGAEKDFETEIIDNWIKRNEPAVPLVSADAILHGLGVILDGNHVPLQEFYGEPEGFFYLKRDTLSLRCATNGCGQHVSVRIERDGIGSDYCEPCGRRAAQS